MADYSDVRAEAWRLVTGLLAAQADGSPARPRSAMGVGDLLIGDLDSLSVVELAIGLESVAGVYVLDDLADFGGRTVDELAAFAVELAARRAEH
jgi:hypothetical protein